ncbi:MAG: hypothetical protein ABJN75_07535 [Hoeflea sp.]|uniref:hypothetical protein n=1 Tax=Hoeflea sp. TaxID=1940281 RepID=UPI003297BE63|tara:strand:- start:10015 stop:10266 length:252 start_codon:yes stop_codon:yes gene_type:complete
MLQILCNLVVPGLGTLFMRKPVVGTIQLLMLVCALVLAATVFLVFFGIVVWFIDLIWALGVGIFWYRRRRQNSRKVTASSESH